MKSIFLSLVVIACSLAGYSQTFSEFPGTGFGMVLPDSSFHFKDRGFVSMKYRTTVLLTNLESDPDLSNVPFEKVVELMRKEFSAPGITVLLDESVTPGNSRLIKVRTGFDTTDAKPATKGSAGITWLYFYNYKGAAVWIMGSYDMKQDGALNNLYYKSLKTLKVVDPKAAADLFKNRFSITSDYAPLKYAGERSGGILLNMEGKYPLTGTDSSYCLIVPMNIIMPAADRENMRSYLKRRLEIHTSSDIRVLGFGTDNKGGFRNYRLYGQTYNNRMMYICIKADDKGCFEIWGEDFYGTSVLPLFDKIEGSLKRD